MKKKTHSCASLSLGMLAMAFLLFIGFVTFISMAEHRYFSVVCLLYRTTGGFTEGYHNSNAQFIGVKGALKIYSSLKDDFEYLQQYQANMNQIMNQNLKDFS